MSLQLLELEVKEAQQEDSRLTAIAIAKRAACRREEEAGPASHEEGRRLSQEAAQACRALALASMRSTLLSARLEDRKENERKGG